MKTTIKNLKFELGLNANTKLESTVIAKAQEFTGLSTSGPKTLLKKVEAIKKANEKAAELKEAKRHNLSRVEYLSLVEKACTILKDFSTGYSMGEYKSLSINEKNIARVDNTSEYSATSKYSATHGSIHITLSKKEIREIENIGGVWTVRLSNNRAKWLIETGSKQYHNVLWKEGYLVGQSHGESLREAQVLEARKERSVTKAKFTDQQYVGVDDIKSLGACNAGIMAFCKKHDLNPEFGYQLGYLKSLNGEGTNYFNRISK